MHSCLLQFDSNLLSLPGFVVMISKLVENVDTGVLSVTCFFLGCHDFLQFLLLLF